MAKQSIEQADFDPVAWDRQLEADAEAGKLDALIQDGLNDLAKGFTTDILDNPPLRGFPPSRE